MNQYRPMVVIKGAGDIATGIAYCLFQNNFDVILTEKDKPLNFRKKAAFAEAVYDGTVVVEGIRASLVNTIDNAYELLDKNIIPVLIDEEASIVGLIHPEVVVDARMAKRNLGTAITEASLVIGIGPGFTAGLDVHAVIETFEGSEIGKAIYKGSAFPNTGEPRNVNGYTVERILRAPVEGIVELKRSIGEFVEKGEVVALVENVPVKAQVSGVLRGMIKEGIMVPKGTKIGDIYPGKDIRRVGISDRALAIGEGVLEVILNFFMTPSKGVSYIWECEI